MAVRCRHGEWVAVKWQPGQFALLLCKFSTLSSTITHSTQLIFCSMKFYHLHVTFIELSAKDFRVEKLNSHYMMFIAEIQKIWLIIMIRM